jgi:hypothetical protein
MDDPPREVDTAEAIDRAVPAGGNTGLERKQAGGAGPAQAQLAAGLALGKKSCSPLI